MRFESSSGSLPRRNHDNSRNTKINALRSEELKGCSRSLPVYLCFFGVVFLISQSFMLWNLPNSNHYWVTTIADNNTIVATTAAAESPTPPPTPPPSVTNDHHRHHTQYDSTSQQEGYDIVTLVHHDDMDTWLQYGLKSWVRHFLPFTTPDAHVYAISSPRAFDVITEQKNKQQQSGDPNGTTTTTSSLFDRVIPVPESLFPFTLNDTKVAMVPQDKPTWVYQQLLKLYAYQVLSTTNTSTTLANIPPIKQLFLLIDSDTVAVRPMPFLATTTDNIDGEATTRPIYNVASDGTGAFPNDCNNYVVPEVFQNTVPKAFPDHSGQRFTTITHHMMIDGPILMEMLAEIERLHGKPTVQVLCGIRQWLSEWELYMAWVMKHHRERIAVKQIPYVNWGTCNDSILEYLRTSKDVFYLTKHDNFSPDNQCCVNSNWSSTECYCCPVRDCGDFRITCDVLGIHGCRDNVETGLMLFTAAESVEQ